MFLKMLKSKIHRARVTETRLDYEGSISIDEGLAKAAGLKQHECVLVANCNNGNRFETYVIYDYAGKGVIAVNGAAAHLTSENDEVIIMAFSYSTEIEAWAEDPKIILVDRNNKIKATP